MGSPEAPATPPDAPKSEVKRVARSKEAALSDVDSLLEMERQFGGGVDGDGPAGGEAERNGEAPADVHVGPIVGDTGGRADKVPMEVPNGSYVLRADFISGLGEGNTDAGMAKLSKMFPESKPSKMRKDPDAVSVLVSHGEFVLAPKSILARWGSLDEGHRALDAWQTAEREKLIETLKKLPPPATD
jgi:hypothetical protein